MHKRKNIGIIKYGPRLSGGKTVRKFQTGGAASVESGYEWREDPYELMLMRQKSEGLGAAKRGASKRSSAGLSATKDPKMGNFDVLEGGFLGTRTALNSQYKALQQQYRDEISKNPPAWVSSLDSQRMFQQVVTTGKEYQEILKREQKQFTDAKSKLNKSDSETLAISSNNNMMVINKDTKAYEFIHMTKYLDEIDKYEPQKLKEFMYWKENIDTSGASGDTRFINEFMVNNATSPEEVIKQYITPNLSSISYRELNGFIVPQENAAGQRFDKNKPVAQVENWMPTIAGAINGTVPKNINETTRVSILDAVEVVYRDILGNTADSSRLQASLYAEVLKDTGHRKKLAAFGTQEEKAQYLETQASLALVKKIYSKNKTTTSTTSDSEGGTNKGKSNALIAGMYRLEDGTQHSGYTVGSDFMTGAEKKQRRVSDIVVPKVNGIYKSGHLNLVRGAGDKDRSNNTVGGNALVKKIANTDNIFLENGMSFNKKMGADQASTFIQENVRIAPSSDIDLLYMFMDNNGNMTMDEGGDVATIKMDNRKAFIKAYNANLPAGETAFAEELYDDMLPGSSDPQAQKAYRLFQNWADTSTNVKTLRKEAQDNLSDQDAQRRWKMAIAAAEMRDGAILKLKKLRSKQLVPVIKLTVLIDNDGTHDLYDMAENHSKQTGYGYGIDQASVTEGDQAYMQDENNVDNSNWFKDWNKMTGSIQPFGDNVYKTNILIPISDMASIVSGYGQEAGEQVGRLTSYNNIQNAANSVINMSSAITNPGNVEAVSKFIRE